MTTMALATFEIGQKVWVDFEGPGRIYDLTEYSPDDSGSMISVEMEMDSAIIKAGAWEVSPY